MASRYWVGGSGTWDGTTTTHWAATSGGAGGASVPTAADDVFLDASSGTGTVTISTAGVAVCRSFDCAGYTGTLSIGSTSNLTSAGTLFRLAAAMALTIGGTSLITLSSTSGTTLVTTAGKTLGAITFDGVGGTFQLQDNLSGGATRNMTLTNGTLDLNGKTVTIGGFSSNSANTRTIKAAGATLNLLNSGTIFTTSNAAGLTPVGWDTWTVNVLNTTSTSKVFFMNAPTAGIKIGIVNIAADAAPGNSTGFVQLNGTSVGALNITGPKYVKLNPSTDKTVDRLSCAGTAGNVVDLAGLTSGTRSVCNLAQSTTAAYTTLTDLEMRGPTLVAGAGCVSGGNLAGITFGRIGLLGAF